MAATSAERLQDLGRKLRILYAYTGLRQASLAKRINRAESTIHDWVAGTDLRDPELVPAEARELLAKLLAEELGETIGVERARQLWMGPIRDFANAFVASTEETFVELLTTVDRTPLLTFLPDGLGDLQLVNFGRRSAERGPLIAFVGDRFALRVAGPPDAYVVFIVESAVGRHLGVPAPELEGKIDSRGLLRLPDEGCWEFEAPAGLHRLLLFVLDRDAPPTISKSGNLVRPLVAEDIDLLVADLTDRLTTRKWSWDQLLVDVRTKLV